ncbi:hypothetical protein QX201_010707 [Fusarium graminearum]
MQVFAIAVQLDRSVENVHKVLLQQTAFLRAWKILKEADEKVRVLRDVARRQTA